MQTTLDNGDRSFNQAAAISGVSTPSMSATPSTPSTLGRLSCNRHAFNTLPPLRRFFFVLLLIQVTGCVAPEMAYDTSPLLSGNGLVPEDLTYNIPVAGALVDAALLGDDANLDQATASPLLATFSGQLFLRYALGCALNRDDSVPNLGDGPSSFPGNLGLAPAWKQRGLTPSEKRALSACMLAHVNAFGVEVSISIRNHDLVGIELGETTQYDFYEATFYGDLFAPVPTLYVCSGQPAPDPMLNSDRAQRVCSESPTEGSSETLCGFELVGSCTAVCDVSVDGNHSDCWNSAAKDDLVFSETMGVWLSSGDAPEAL